MSAAFFVLAISICIAVIFATAFAVVAVTSRSAVSARWLSAAYGMGALYLGLEFMLPLQPHMAALSVAVFTTFLLAETLVVIGLACHYALSPPWRLLAVVVGLSVLVNVLSLDMERASLLRTMLYQLPYAVMQVIAVLVVLRAPATRRGALDLLLLSLYTIGAMQFLAKPLLAAVIGAGATERDYITTSYAAISQASGAVLLVANGLLLLLVLVRASMHELKTHSETDALSGLLNRRGFENRAAVMLERAGRQGVPMTLLVADLDHFKAINDDDGHAVGDSVIAAFAAVLRQTAPPGAAMGRIGGEEFAILVPAEPLDGVTGFVEAVRQGIAAHSVRVLAPGKALTVSLGVAELQRDEQLLDVMRRADMALYHAKKSGRDRASVAEIDIVTTDPLPDRWRDLLEV